MIEDGRNPRDKAGRRSQDEGNTDEEEKGKGDYLHNLGDCQLDRSKITIEGMVSY